MGGRETNESREQWLEDIDMKASLNHLLLRIHRSFDLNRPCITLLLSALGSCCMDPALWALATLSNEAGML